MRTLCSFFLFLCIALPLKGVYEPLRYKQFITERVKQLTAQQQFNEKKIRALEAQQAYATRKKGERKSITLENELRPILKSTSSTLEGLQAENALLKAESNRLTQQLTPSRLATLKDLTDENNALKRVEVEASIDELKRSQARAQFAQQFFEQERKTQAPELTSQISSFEKQWAKQATSLNTQLLQKETLLKSTR